MKQTLAVTEQRNPKTMQLDTMSALQIAQIMNAEDEGVAAAVKTALPQIAMAIDFAADSFAQGGRLIYLGAGTSGRLGVLDASECPPTFGVPESMVVGLIAGGRQAVWQAVEGAEDSCTQAEQDLRAIHLAQADTVVGLAASGRTPSVLYGLRHAKNLGCKTAAIDCNRKSAIGQEADTAIEVEVGPEILTGSTRLKSGTAQKMVLNMISTGAMVRSGYVYENLMVNLQVSNKKLQGRAVRIVQQAAGCTSQEAETLLQQAKGDVKTAIVMQLLGVPCDSAEKLLKQNGAISARPWRKHDENRDIVVLQYPKGKEPGNPAKSKGRRGELGVYLFADTGGRPAAKKTGRQDNDIGLPGVRHMAYAGHCSRYGCLVRLPCGGRTGAMGDYAYPLG